MEEKNNCILCVSFFLLIHGHHNDAGPDAKQIQVGVLWAKQQLEKGRTLFVHCAHGHGRSATVLGAVLIALGEVETIDEAVKMMQKSRPRVRLNNRQRASLNAWYEEHHLKKE